MCSKSPIPRDIESLTDPVIFKFTFLISVSDSNYVYIKASPPIYSGPKRLISFEFYDNKTEALNWTNDYAFKFLLNWYLILFLDWSSIMFFILMGKSAIFFGKSVIKLNKWVVQVYEFWTYISTIFSALLATFIWSILIEQIPFFGFFSSS